MDGSAFRTAADLDILVVGGIRGHLLLYKIIDIGTDQFKFSRLQILDKFSVYHDSDKSFRLQDQSKSSENTTLFKYLDIYQSLSEKER